jgi:phosphatidylglycerophosphate synthase
MLSRKLGHRLDKPLAPVVCSLASLGVSPNMLTVAGLIMSAAAGVVLAFDSLVLGGVLVLVGGLFDFFDGMLARVANKQTRFGEVYDSTLDRYSDIIPIFGLMLHYSGWRASAAPRFELMTLCCVVIAGTFLVPYVRARAEPLVGRCDIGFAERAERVILFGGGLVIGMEAAALLALAALTHLTIVQRLIYVRHQLKENSRDCDAAVSDDEKLADSNLKSEF